VPDAYTSVSKGHAPATYINIRTLCNALANLKQQYDAAQKEDAE